MSYAVSNTIRHKQPLGERSLNHSISERGDHGNGSVLKTNAVRKSIAYTPNHRRTPGGLGNASFKSPITLCFDRMLGAGEFERESLTSYPSALSISQVAIFLNLFVRSFGLFSIYST